MTVYIVMCSPVYLETHHYVVVSVHATEAGAKAAIEKLKTQDPKGTMYDINEYTVHES